MARSSSSDSVTGLPCMVRGHSATTGVIPRQGNCSGLAGWTQGSHKGPDKRRRECQREEMRLVSDVAGGQRVTDFRTGEARPGCSPPTLKRKNSPTHPRCGRFCVALSYPLWCFICCGSHRLRIQDSFTMLISGSGARLRL